MKAADARTARPRSSSARLGAPADVATGLFVMTLDDALPEPPRMRAVLDDLVRQHVRHGERAPDGRPIVPFEAMSAGIHAELLLPVVLFDLLGMPLPQVVWVLRSPQEVILAQRKQAQAMILARYEGRSLRTRLRFALLWGAWWLGRFPRVVAGLLQKARTRAPSPTIGA